MGSETATPADTPKPGLSKNQVFLLATALVALVAVAVAAVLVWLWLPTLPNPIATHWGVGTSPSPRQFILTLSLIMGAAVLLMAAISFSVGNSRFGAQVTGGAAVFLGVMTLLLVVVSVGPQRGLADAQDATLSGGGIVLVVGGSAVAGVIAALFAPKAPPVGDAAAPPPADAPRANITPDADFLWVGKTSINPALLWGFIIIFVLIFGAIAITSRTWWLILLGLLPIVVTLSLSPFTVRITPAGLSGKSPIGWPKKTITAAQIDQASVVEVKPLAEFGGWGYRLTTGGVEGIVLRKGPGIRIDYGKNSALVITLNEGADEAAALLNTAADRTH